MAVVQYLELWTEKKKQTNVSLNKNATIYATTDNNKFTIYTDS